MKSSTSSSWSKFTRWPNFFTPQRSPQHSLNFNSSTDVSHLPPVSPGSTASASGRYNLSSNDSRLVCSSVRLSSFTAAIANCQSSFFNLQPFTAKEHQNLGSEVLDFCIANVLRSRPKLPPSSKVRSRPRLQRRPIEYVFNRMHLLQLLHLAALC